MWSGFYCYCLHSHCLAHLDSQLLSGYECLRYEMAVTVPLQQGPFDHLVYDQLPRGRNFLLEAKTCQEGGQILHILYCLNPIPSLRLNSDNAIQQRVYFWHVRLTIFQNKKELTLETTCFESQCVTILRDLLEIKSQDSWSI